MNVNSKFENLGFGKTKIKIDKLLKKRAKQNEEGKKEFDLMSCQNITICSDFSIAFKSLILFLTSWNSI